MWTTEYSIETTAAPDAIWRACADVSRLPEWNSDIQRIASTGPFAAGSTIAAVSADFGETLTALVAHAGR